MPTRYIEVCSRKTHRKHHVLVYQPIDRARTTAPQSLSDFPHRVHLDDGRPLQWTAGQCFRHLRSDEEFAPVARDPLTVSTLAELPLASVG
ncbi:hypothetical protein [Dokdonella immobilis]|uniref:Uncharacterized protein n=1 Tax=Dokdonella immobilis TaxID=578942 RepID=A0A1I4W226_9GAMM|nr:hypothetical protein [Dokdonella immobilis]SFN07533.1 hypothetical protein SAMN05216289_103282 [Dokdonella immobilis]